MSKPSAGHIANIASIGQGRRVSYAEARALGYGQARGRQADATKTTQQNGDTGSVEDQP